MRRCGVVCALATIAALCLLQGYHTAAAPSPRTDDLLKTLQDLEQIYSSMARPSVAGGSGVSAPEMSKKVQRAMKMIEMRRLERLYAHRARPRFGKRDRLATANAIYRNVEPDDALEQPQDDGRIAAAARWAMDAMAADAASGDAAPPPAAALRQKLQQLYRYQLN